MIQGQYSGSILMWCQQYEWVMSYGWWVQMVQLVVPAWSVQPDAFKNVPTQPGGSHCCTHLMNISLITTHRPSTRYRRHMSTGFQHQKIFWCRDFDFAIRMVCVCPLDDAFACPLSGQDPPSLPQYVKTPGVKIWDPSEGQAPMESGLEKVFLCFCFKSQLCTCIPGI